MSKTALVLGGGGFIGHHLVSRLRRDGWWVRAVDRKTPEFADSEASHFMLRDLRDRSAVRDAFRSTSKFDAVFQLAAEMGGAGYCFTGEHDAEIMWNSSKINLNVLEACREYGAGRVFFSSSACVYWDQTIDGLLENAATPERVAYPANPDSDYGWEKLFSERLYQAHARQYGLQVRIARYHNIFGELGTWRGGREKAPAAICRKVALAPSDGEVEIWGDGSQVRSFLHVNEAVEGTLRLMESDFAGPVNIGSSESVTITDLVWKVAAIAGKKIHIKCIDGPIGVNGRNSDNTLAKEKLGWAPSESLDTGLRRLYPWIESQVGMMACA